MKKLLKRILTPDNIFLELRAESKTDLISEMIDKLADCGHISDKSQALQAVLDREKKMSTGMKHGVAIPHGKTDSVEKLVVAIGLKKAGIDFDSTDNKPATIFIMTISPANRSGPHIQFLAEVSRILRDAEARKRMLAARDENTIIKIFS